MNRFSAIVANIVRAMIPLLIFAAGIYGFMVFGKRPQTEESNLDVDPVTAVEVVRVEVHNEPFYIELDGVSAPYRQITFGAEVGGRIEKKSEECRSGHFVQEGDFLIQIDKTDYQLEIKRLAAQKMQSEESINEIDIELANTEGLIEIATEDLKLRTRNMKRLENLFQRGAVNETEKDDAKRAELTSKNSLQTLMNQKRSSLQKKKGLEAALEIVAAQLERAEEDLERTTIHAPITGGIIEHLVEEGDYIKAGDPIIKIHDTTKVEVMCHLEFDDLYWVWLQQGLLPEGRHEQNPNLRYEIPETPVEISFTFQGTEFLWDGKLSRYEGTGLDDQTRTLPCRVLVEKPDESRMKGYLLSRAIVSPPTLLTGLFVDIRIPIETDLSMLKLPHRAVRPGGKVYVVRDQKLKTLEISIARSLDDGVLVRQADSPLQHGDLVIISPMPMATDEMPIKVVNEPSQIEATASLTKLAEPSDTNSTTP